MALALNDRVQQQGTANTTVSFTLTTSVTGFQSFAVIGNGNTTYYGATDASGNWEVGVGTYSTTGPTLTRTTILASSNSGSAVTFSGTVNVFVTYPSEKSVNLDGSNNVSALGTVSSGTWQGSTIAVTYGGTGVTSSSGASSVVIRDANSNIVTNNFLAGYTAVTAAAGTTVLTASSSFYQRLGGSTTQTFQLPVGTTMALGQAFVFDNDSSGTLTVVDNASGAVDTIPSGGYGYIFCEDNTTSAGSWGKYALLPANYDFNTTSANFGAAVISNTTYQGTAVASGYGGTGLTTFSAANNALYSTSASALAAGTLPIAAGGTAATTFTANGVLYGNGTSALGVTSAGTTGQVLLANTSGAPTWGSVPSTGAVTTFQTSLNGLTPSTATAGTVTLAGTLGAISGGTSFSTYATGDLIYASATNTLSKLTAGTNGYVLTLASGVPSWAASSSGVTVTNDTSTASALYPTFTSATSGSISGVSVTSTKLNFTPSTGALAAPEVVASNGMLVHSSTVSTSYSIPAGSNAIAAGPMTVASGAAVTIPSGSRWLVL
jgi:hypothetical protein